MIDGKSTCATFFMKRLMVLILHRQVMLELMLALLERREKKSRLVGAPRHEVNPAGGLSAGVVPSVQGAPCPFLAWLTESLI